MKRILLLAFILFYITLSAQAAVFAPFVSGLHAIVAGKKVELIWVDSQSVTGKVLIYRSLSPFTAVGGAGQEKLAEVYYGRQTYTDEVPSNGDWHYLLIATSGTNENFDMVVPNNNIVDVSVDGGVREVAASSFSAPAKSAEEYTSRYKQTQMEEMSGDDVPPNGIYAPSYAPPSYASPAYTGISTPSSTLALTGLSAYPEGNMVRINFLSGTPSKNAVLYRNIAPILNLSDLLASEVVQLPGIKSPVLDNVSPGVPCYYAIIYEEDIRDGSAYIAPGYNSTVYPIVLQGTPPAVSGGNPPVVSSAVSSAELSEIPYSTPSSLLSPQAAAALEDTSLIKGAPYQDARAAPIIISEPKIFKQDLQDAVVGSDEYKLQSVVKDYFRWRNWDAAIKGFSQVITGARSPAVEARARFYLGQSYYFAGTVRAALTEFLAVQSRFPDESAIWIQASLNKLSGR